MMYVTSALLHKYTFVLMIKGLSTHIRIFLKTESFSVSEKIRVHTQCIRIVFSRPHENAKRLKYDSVP